MPRRPDAPGGGASSARLAGLDLLRAAAMLLGLAYHATTSWLPGVGPWYFVADASPVPLLVTVAGVLHAFRMQLFFALSGAFSRLVFERRGPAGFLRDRARRLLVPLLVALPLVWLLDLAVRASARAAGLMARDYGPQDAFRGSPVHLWFLAYLCCFCAAAWGLARAGLTGGERLAPLLRRPALLLVVLSAPTCLGLWLHPENRPDLAPWPLPFEALHYGLFFTFGWLLWPARGALGPLTAWAPAFTALGGALSLWVFGGPLQWQPVGHVAAGAVAWLLTLGLLGLSLRVPAGERPWLRFLVDSSYWVYLVHYPVVTALQRFFAQRSLPGPLEYALTVGGAAAFAFTTYALLVRPTRLGAWLGARRAPGP